MADGLQAINPGWPWYEAATFSPAVRKGNLLFISGMTAVDEDGKLIGPGNIFTQTEYIYNRIEQVVRAAGGSLDDVVMTTEYITTTEDYRRPAPGGTGAPQVPGALRWDRGPGGALRAT